MEFQTFGRFSRSCRITPSGMSLQHRLGIRPSRIIRVDSESLVLLRLIWVCRPPWCSDACVPETPGWSGHHNRLQASTQRSIGERLARSSAVVPGGAQASGQGAMLLSNKRPLFLYSTGVTLWATLMNDNIHTVEGSPEPGRKCYG